MAPSAVCSLRRQRRLYASAAASQPCATSTSTASWQWRRITRSYAGSRWHLCGATGRDGADPSRPWRQLRSLPTDRQRRMDLRDVHDAGPQTMFEFAFCCRLRLLQPLLHPGAGGIPEAHRRAESSMASVHECFSGQLASDDYDDQRDGRQHWIGSWSLHGSPGGRCGRYGARGGQRSSNDNKRISTSTF